MKDKPGDIVRLHHILDAVSELEKYTAAKTFIDFFEDTMLQSACIRQLEIIGEAANRISNNIKTKSENIEWREIIGLRNILIHEYFGIDVDLIWEIIRKDIPKLKDSVKSQLVNIEEK